MNLLSHRHAVIVVIPYLRKVFWMLAIIWKENFHMDQAIKWNNSLIIRWQSILFGNWSIFAQKNCFKYFYFIENWTLNICWESNNSFFQCTIHKVSHFIVLDGLDVNFILNDRNNFLEKKNRKWIQIRNTDRSELCKL